MLSLVLLGALVASCHALGKDVVELTPANFKSKVLESDDVWLVEFYGLLESLWPHPPHLVLGSFKLQLLGAVCL
jgi:hypothetical protein